MPPDTPTPRPDASGERYRFGLFEVNSADGIVIRQGKAVKLQGQPFQLLVALLERNGEVVGREELRQRLWPGDTFVDFDKSLGVAITKLRDALDDEASNPRFIETLPRRGYRFIAPVERLAYGPATPAFSTTPASPGGLEGAVEADAEMQPAGEEVEAARRSGWQRLSPILVVICLIAVVGLAVRYFRRAPVHEEAGSRDATLPIPAAHVRRSVAILGFRNLAGRPEDAWISAAFSEMLDTELAAGGALRLVAGEDVARAKRELPISDEATLAKATLQRLRGNPGADLVVLGSYATVQKDGKTRIRLDLRLQDTSSGETVAEESAVGAEDGLFEMAGEAGGRLRRAMGLQEVSAQETISARTTLPGNPQAVRLYAQGRRKLWNFDYLGARDLLVKAVAADPQYPLSHAALSEAWWHLGYEAKSRAEAQRAAELSGNLPEEERLLVEAQYRRSVEDWPKAVEACQALYKLFPDRLDYGLLLASAQNRINTVEALQTLSALKKLPAPIGDDPRIDILEARALINSDLAKSREAGKRAIAKAMVQGAHVLVADTEATLCQQAVGAGVGEAASECEAARQTSVAVGDHNGAAMALNNLAAIYYQAGDLVRAEKEFLQVLEEFQKIGNLDGVATAMSNLGGVLQSLGDPRRARKYLEESIPNYEAVEDHEGVALALNNLGDLARQSGELEAARINYQRAMETARQYGEKNAQAYVLSGLGDVLYDRGELAEAKKSYETALELRTQLGEPQYMAESRVSLALVAIEEQYAADAEVTLRKCEQEFHEAHEADDELSAAVDLSSALLAQGKNSEAQQQIQSIRELAGRSQNRLARLQYALAAARAVLASEHPEQARGMLTKILRDVRETGFAGMELQVRLAQAELEKRTGRAAEGKAQYAAVENEARARGFGLIAKKAQQG